MNQPKKLDEGAVVVPLPFPRVADNDLSRSEAVRALIERGLKVKR